MVAQPAAKAEIAAGAVGQRAIAGARGPYLGASDPESQTPSRHHGYGVKSLIVAQCVGPRQPKAIEPTGIAARAAPVEARAHLGPHIRKRQLQAVDVLDRVALIRLPISPNQIEQGRFVRPIERAAQKGGELRWYLAIR